MIKIKNELPLVDEKRKNIRFYFNIDKELKVFEQR